MSAELTSSPPATLDSWQEIARYLHRGLRTVQRWHIELGLPVYRSNGAGRKTVFAVPSELDQWLKDCPTVLLRQNTLLRERIETRKYDSPFLANTRELILQSRQLRLYAQNSRKELRQRLMELKQTVSNIKRVRINLELEPRQPTMFPACPNKNDADGKRRPEILNSWKEIASYLKRGVRTVQRWERELGLPVRRPRGRDRSSVIALRNDIDLWNDMRARGQPPKGARLVRSYDLSPVIAQAMWLNNQLSQEIEKRRKCGVEFRAAIDEFRRTVGKMLGGGESRDGHEWTRPLSMPRNAIRMIRPPRDSSVRDLVVDGLLNANTRQVRNSY